MVRIWALRVSEFWRIQLLLTIVQDLWRLDSNMTRGAIPSLIFGHPAHLHGEKMRVFLVSFYAAFSVLCCDALTATTVDVVETARAFPDGG
jgi:hypothetical protein